MVSSLNIFVTPMIDMYYGWINVIDYGDQKPKNYYVLNRVENDCRNVLFTFVNLIHIHKKLFIQNKES